MMQRVSGFDLARALAIFGMVIVNFKIAMNAETGSPLLMNFVKLFEGRASALFVILAGIGVTFLTNKVRGSTDKILILKSRMSFSIAKDAYEDLTSEAEKEKFRALHHRRLSGEERQSGLGRPTKRDRREIENFKEIDEWLHEDLPYDFGGD